MFDSDAPRRVLLGVLGIALLVTVAAALTPHQNLIFLDTLIPAESALLGAAAAYYFQGQVRAFSQAVLAEQILFVGVLGLVFLGTVIFLVWFPDLVNRTVSAVLLPTETALLGIAVAYYFQAEGRGRELGARSRRVRRDGRSSPEDDESAT